MNINQSYTIKHQVNADTPDSGHASLLKPSELTDKKEDLNRMNTELHAQLVGRGQNALPSTTLHEQNTSVYEEHDRLGLAFLQHIACQSLNVITATATLVNGEAFHSPLDTTIWGAVAGVAGKTKANDQTATHLDLNAVNRHLVSVGALQNDALRHRWNDVASPGGDFYPLSPWQLSSLAVSLSEVAYAAKFYEATGGQYDTAAMSTEQIDVAIARTVENLRALRKIVADIRAAHTPSNAVVA